MSGKKIEWDAPEYIVDNEHNKSWYIVLIVVCLALIAIAIFLIHNWSFVALIIVAAIALIVYVKNPPKNVHHVLDGSQITVGHREFKISDYKNFGVIVEGATAVALTPKKRFAQTLVLYFPEANGEAIVDFFGNRLPMKEIKLDLLDRFLRFLKI